MTRSAAFTLFAVSMISFQCVTAIQALFLSKQANAAETAEEHVLKATFLYNFTRYVEWPDYVFEANDSPLLICVVGDSPISSALKPLENKSVNNRILQIKQLSARDSVAGCHVLYVSKEEKSSTESILSKAGDGMLTVSDIKNFSSYGGVISLQTIRNKVRFSVNLKSGNKLGLKISARLLRLAISVEE